MNDPVAVRFVNERVRPMAEKLRALKAEADSFMAAYNNGVGDTVVDAQLEFVDDGRDAEGITRLTCNDVILLVTQVSAIKTQLDGAGVAGVIEKPCVRPVTVSVG